MKIFAIKTLFKTNQILESKLKTYLNGKRRQKSKLVDDSYIIGTRNGMIKCGPTRYTNFDSLGIYPIKLFNYYHVTK